jgi:hypothetical protein
MSPELALTVVVETAEVDVTIQLQADETRLATLPVQAAAANEGMALVAVTTAVVKVPQKALTSSRRFGARSPRRQLSALQVIAATAAGAMRARAALS